MVEPSSLTTRQYELAIPSWSKDLAGLRVAVLADLHVGSRFNGLSKLERIVELTNRLKPDLIVIPGDFVIDGVIGGRSVSPEDAAAAPGRLTAPLGVGPVWEITTGGSIREESGALCKDKASGFWKTTLCEVPPEISVLELQADTSLSGRP